MIFRYNKKNMTEISFTDLTTKELINYQNVKLFNFIKKKIFFLLQITMMKIEINNI